jgi:hypothetical protein
MEGIEVRPYDAAEADSLVQSYVAGKIDRRNLLRQLMLLGMGAQTAYVLIGEVPPLMAQTEPAPEGPKPFSPNRDRLTAQFTVIQKLLLRKEILDLIQELNQATTDGDRLRISHKVAELTKDPEYLKSLDPAIDPRDFRVTMRVFERSADSPIEGRTLYIGPSNPVFAPTAGSLCASLGVGICISYGYPV